MKTDTNDRRADAGSSAEAGNVIDLALTPQERREMMPYFRKLCDAMQLFHLCGRVACGKARRCRGDACDCLDTRGPRVPALASEWATMVVDLREAGRSNERLDLALPREHLAFTHWIAGLEARRE